MANEGKELVPYIEIALQNQRLTTDAVKALSKARYSRKPDMGISAEEFVDTYVRKQILLATVIPDKSGSLTDHSAD